MTDNHRIERRVSYTDVPHKDPARRVVFVHETVSDNQHDTFLQISGSRSGSCVVTAEFMRDAVNALETAGRTVEAAWQ